MGLPLLRELPGEKECPPIFKQTAAKGLGPLVSKESPDKTELLGTLKWEKLVLVQIQR